MGQAKGYKGQTMLDFETDFKVEPTTKAGKIIPFNTNEVAASQNLNDPATITGTRNPVEPFKGNESVDGQLQLPLDFRAIGYIFKGLLGAPETTDNGNDTYTHVFKVKDEGQPSMIIQKAFLNISKYFIYHGCKISSFQLPFGGDGEAVATCAVMGSLEEIKDVTYDADATSVVLNRAENFQAAIKENGINIVGVVKSGEINIDAGLDGDQYCVGDKGTRGDIPEGLIACTGSLSSLFKDTRFVDKAAEGTESSLELSYTKGDNKLSFLFPEIVYERTSPTITGPSGVMCDVNWKAYWSDGAEGSAVVITLTNDVESY